MDEATVRTKSFVKLRGCCSWVLALHRGSSCSSLSLDTCPVVWDSLHAVASNPPSRIRGVSKPFHKLKNLIYLSSKFEVISFTHTFPNSHAGVSRMATSPPGRRKQDSAPQARKSLPYLPCRLQSHLTSPRIPGPKALAVETFAHIGQTPRLGFGNVSGGWRYLGERMS